MTEMTRTLRKTTTATTTLKPTGPTTTTPEQTTTTPWSEICQEDCHGKWTHCLEGCLQSDGSSDSLCESSCFTNYYECLNSCDDNKTIAY